MASFGYANDVTRLAPTPTAVSTLLKTCKQFAEKYYIKFNPGSLF